MTQSDWEILAKRIRANILVSTTAAGSGHPTSSLSAVDLMTVLFFEHLKYDLDKPQNPANDRVIFSKGHASPLFYSLYEAAGKLSYDDVLKLRTFDSPLEGHATLAFPFTEAPTGSLGQGLSIGVGEALALRMSIQTDDPESWQPLPRVYVLSGDGELAEGQVWEAAALASKYKLYNLVLIVDINRLGQSAPTMLERDTTVLRKRFESFGWGVIVIDGHTYSQIDAAYEKAFTYKDGPVAILAETVKGKGVSFLEDKSGWHGKALKKDECEKALGELGDIDRSLAGVVLKPDSFTTHVAGTGSGEIPTISYPVETPVATRKAFGQALTRLGSTRTDLVVLDGDVQNSTYTELFAAQYPDRFIQCYIAEQNIASMALGMAKRGYLPVVSSFACFLTRAFDQIRMAALADAHFVVNGSHAGVSIGEDGASQMGLEDLGMMRAVFGSTVLYPADPYAAEALTEEALNAPGIVYIRTTREATPVLYTAGDTFQIGGSRTFEPHARFRESNDQTGSKKSKKSSAIVTIIAAGITLHEALKAQKKLEESGIPVRVIDCYSIKPIDKKTLMTAAKDSRLLIVVEDHYPEGGLGSAVFAALAEDSHPPIKHLAVRKLPHSGKPAELLHHQEIDAEAILTAIQG